MVKNRKVKRKKKCIKKKINIQERLMDETQRKYVNKEKREPMSKNRMVKRKKLYKKEDKKSGKVNV